jgi:hypothetical protein
MIRKKLGKMAMVGALTIATAFSAKAVDTADVIFIVDESGSMAGEHAWIENMVTSLDAALGTAGVTGNRYGLVGFGTSSHGAGLQQPAHEHTVGGAALGTAADLSSAAASGLVASGGLEDGWQAIDFALNNYSFRGNAAVNFILITDEDRDITNPLGVGLTYDGVLQGMTDANILLNAVVNGNFRDDSNTRVLGHDSDGNSYAADGSGGFTTGTAGAAFGAGTTIANYYDMALDTGGAAWDLNLLRAGGNTATSFTAAFVDVKVQEITTQPPTSGVPDAGATSILLLGAFATLAGLRRRIGA